MPPEFMLVKVQKLDLNFGLARGIIGSKHEMEFRNNHAPKEVVMKADNARIIGRNGVKIVSGRSFAFKGAGIKGETNARGGAIQEPRPTN